MSKPTTWREAFKRPLYYDRDGSCIMHENGKLIDLRGWGWLTGTGGHNLSPEEAAKIQDDFGNELVELLIKMHSNDRR